MRRTINTLSDGACSRLSMDEIASLCKLRGFIFPGSEVYGSIGTSYDYGPLGAQLKRNVIDKWWRDFVSHRPDCVGVDTGILLNPQVWEVAGHVDEFVDPLSECKSCQSRFRADHLVEDIDDSVDPSDMQAMETILSGLKCPNCGAAGEKGLMAPREFNLLFQTSVGATSKESGKTFLRPETAQGTAIHFMNICNTTRRRLPFGVGHVGHAFRNEIGVSNFIFRTREFEMMELQYYIKADDAANWLEYWVEFCHEWLVSLGLDPTRIRRRQHDPEALAHYATDTFDLEYDYPFGWGELWGIAHRGDVDVKRHAEATKVDMRFKDPVSNERFFPHVIEPSVGVNRLVLAILADAWCHETVESGGKSSKRLVLKLHEDVAPFQIAVLPLLKRPEFLEAAESVFSGIVAHSNADYDTAGSIGKRYRRHDEIGTPLCATIDHQTLEDGSVTLRCRDSMKQIRVDSSQLRDAPARRSRFHDQFEQA